MPCWMSCSPAAGRKPAEKSTPQGCFFGRPRSGPGPAAEPPPGFARRPRAFGSRPPSLRDGGGSAAYRAELKIRHGALGGKGGLQRRIKGKNGLPEIAAIAPRPALAEHIALAV